MAAAPNKPKKLLRWVACLSLSYVMGVNYLVRSHGGDPSLLSISRLSEKTSALARLSLHSVRHLWSDACSDTRHFVIEAAKAEGVPASFALSIARHESGFRSHSISSTGAMGIMQLMPATALRHGVIDPFDPEDNARGAARYIKALWTRYHGDRMRVAAAYNAGERGVPQKGKMRVPGSTLGYAASVVKQARLLAPFAPVELTAPLVITANER
jgi:soluble lytic murein transglycosylase-like protein